MSFQLGDRVWIFCRWKRSGEVITTWRPGIVTALPIAKAGGALFVVGIDGVQAPPGTRWRVSAVCLRPRDNGRDVSTWAVGAWQPPVRIKRPTLPPR